MIADSAVAHVNMADNSVGHDEMRNDAIGTNELQDGAVTAVKLAATLDLSAKTLTLSAAQKAADYLEYREQQTAGTNGGTFTSGAWQTRVLNTEVHDTGSHGSLSSNQITLAAGTYLVEIHAPARACAFHQARLYNVTDAATAIVGSSNESGTGSGQTAFSLVVGRITIAASKTFEVQHRCSATAATTGFGSAVNFGEVEVYTVARFWKVA